MKLLFNQKLSIYENATFRISFQNKTSFSHLYPHLDLDIAIAKKAIGLENELLKEIFPIDFIFYTTMTTTFLNMKEAA